MKITVHYFAELYSTIYGTPLVSIPLEVSPSLEVAKLKSMMCHIAQEGMIEDMMAFMRYKEFAQDEMTYSRSTTVLAQMFSSRKLSEQLTISELNKSDTKLALSIDIDWLKRCRVCNAENLFTRVEHPLGCDNIPDLTVDYHCSNSRCSERNVRKRFIIRIAPWFADDCSRCAVPVITAVENLTLGAMIWGSKGKKPTPVSAPETIQEDSVYCNCGAQNPVDVSYCWNCGRKTHLQHQGTFQFPSDMKELREHVRMEEQKASSRLVSNSKEFVKKLVERRIIIEVTLCKYCGEYNDVGAINCKKCGEAIERPDEKYDPERRVRTYEKDFASIWRNLLSCFGLIVMGLFLLALAGQPILAIGGTLLIADAVSYGISGASATIIGFVALAYYISKRNQTLTELAILKETIEESKT